MFVFLGASAFIGENPEDLPPLPGAIFALFGLFIIILFSEFTLRKVQRRNGFLYSRGPFGIYRVRVAEADIEEVILTRFISRTPFLRHHYALKVIADGDRIHVPGNARLSREMETLIQEL